MNPDPSRPKDKPPLPTIGWREWLSIPELGVPFIKAKVDTGARSSALHAFDIQPFKWRGREFVRFTIHPLQRSMREKIVVEAPLLEYRTIRDSGGKLELRPVILTTVKLGDEEWFVEVTLTRRDAMGFRMLLGRQAVRERFLVDPGRSYRIGKKKKKKKKKKKVKKGG